ncbi:hypothetical protein DYI24_00750 [Rhodopseudomonas sp. BR0C11]|uniref:hypothetical protein n=1 Tax=Rhodopseudomonas sp. BR0C11 TaxID=2269370 RepID=UPI0013DEB952|nr:hypothetical protein [Rhodopseudomonas sp. BR0C11]NEV75607.1 hypothetical protein [Rhodopseudomonas sp. BR0C11]
MIALQNGTEIEPDDATPVECPVHGVKTTWGQLSPIQRLAVETGLDTADDLPCILAHSNHG